MVYAGLTLCESYFEDLELAKTHPGKGANYTKRDEFIVRYSLRESESKAYPKWGRLLPSNITAKYRTRYTNNFEAVGDLEIMSHQVNDHYELFTNKGKYLYVTQPYSLHLQTYRRLEKVWTSFGLYVDISYIDAWWFPGRTPLIAISQYPIELRK